MSGTPGNRAGGLPVGFIGMVGLIVALECGVATRMPEFCADPAVFQWRATHEAVYGTEVKQCDVLCFGDSLVKLGIYPRILEASLGCRAFNLAMPAAPAPGSYFLLRRALDRGARPRALVVDSHTMLLQFSPRQSVEYWPELLTARELVELALTARDPRLFSVTAVAKVLPSVNNRHGIRAAWLESLRGQPDARSGLYRVLTRNLKVNRGAYVPALRNPQLIGAAVGAHARDAAAAAEAPPWASHWANRLYLERFFDLAATRSIPVFWLLPPTDPEWQAISDRVGRDARFTAFVREVQSHYANVIVLDARRAGYGHELFADLTHLDQRGARELSESVAASIGAYLASARAQPKARWVALDRTQERRLHVPLEDLEQSTAIVRAAGERMRR